MDNVLRLFLIPVIVLVSCAPAVVLPPVRDSPDDEVTIPEQAEQSQELAPTSSAVFSEQSDEDPSTIARTQLEQILDKGPGAFLAGVQVKAKFRGKRFQGWQVAGLSGASYSDAGIQVGDIVQRVNEYSLRTPTDLERLWKSLWTANSMVVIIQRAGQRAELRYEIKD